MPAHDARSGGRDNMQAMIDKDMPYSPSNLKLRKCEVMVRTELGYEWREQPFGELKKGQVFRLFDSDGVKPKWEDGTEICAALTDAAETEPEGNHVVESLILQDLSTVLKGRGVGKSTYIEAPSMGAQVQQHRCSQCGYGSSSSSPP